MIRIKISVSVVCFLLLFLTGCKKTSSGSSEIGITEASQTVPSSSSAASFEEDSASWNEAWGDDGLGTSNGTSSQSTLSQGTSGTANETTTHPEGTGSLSEVWTPNY